MERLPMASRRTALLFAWGGTLLFVLALAYFVYSYAITFGRAAQPGSRSGAIAWDVSLFTVFALHHSVFARIGVREWVSRVLPPELERSAYVWLASVLFIIVCALWAPVPGLAWQVRGAARWPLWLVQGAGVWLTLSSAAALDVYELAGVRQAAGGAQAGEAAGPAPFTASGPYAWVRHPIYAGWLLMVFAAPVMTMTRLVFAVVSGSYLLIAIPLEERSLRTTSSGIYDRYTQAVRWKLIPRVY